MSLFQRFVSNESGATAVEYSLIAALVTVASITTLTTFGNNFGNLMNKVSNNINK